MPGFFTKIQEDGEKIKDDIENLGNKALGAVVNPIVECTDVDGIVRRINVNDVVERIDVNALLDRVDVNKQLDRVDVNALMRRVDFDEVVERSNLAAIVAQSSTGVFTGIMDSLRVEIVYIDLCMLRLFQCNRKVLPPAPGKIDTLTPYPETKMAKAIAVQEHYCGLFSKGLALLIDWLLMLLLLAIFSIAVESAYLRIDALFIKSESAQEAWAETNDLWFTIITLLAWFLYFWLSVALPGQTFGMCITGVRVVQDNGDKDVPWIRAAIRTLALWVVVFCWPLSIWIGIIRRDGRMPHDILVCTGMIYKWNARMADLREKTKQRAEATGADKEELNP